MKFPGQPVGKLLRPEMPRPYKGLGYPVVPAVFIVPVGWLVVNALISEPISTGITLTVILTGIPIYYVFFRSDREGFR